MKTGQSLRCLFWALLYCLLYLANAANEDLMDFDFTDLKEIDWNYENSNKNNMPADNNDSVMKKSAKPNLFDFDDDEFLEENQVVHPFDWREKMLRTALSKALTNRAARQKFVEIMPILRVLSKQQRLALSALITAQISAKPGHELKLNQVRMMFGDDKSLILPIVYDIANMVRNSARKYIKFDYDIKDLHDFAETKSNRRKLDLNSEELLEEDNNLGIVKMPATAKMTQTKHDDDDLESFMSAEVLDPQEINMELQKIKTENVANIKTMPTTLTMSIEEPLTDPVNINHELQKDVPTLTLLKKSKSEIEDDMATLFMPTSETELNSSQNKTKKNLAAKRQRRSIENSEFVHKLIRSVPLTVDEFDLQRGAAGRTLKLNTTAFATPKEIKNEQQSENATNYQIVEDLAFADMNGTETLLTANEGETENVDNEDELAEASEIMETAANENQERDGSNDEALPTPEELISGPRYRLVAGNKLVPMRSKHSVITAKRKRIQVRTRPQENAVIGGGGVAAPRKCERFTASMCIKTEDYPMELIMGSIRRHRNAMTALLAEYSDKPSKLIDSDNEFDQYLFSKKRREDNEVHGGMCQSIIRYARPQKARSASGEWKFIVNTGQHTQTLRLEKCTNPQESCSYLANSFKSHCSQVYNYHRLLSWDKTRGLHVDIFKVPTCCSCQIDGYKSNFPPLEALKHKEFSPAFRGDPYLNSKTKHETDYDEEEDDEHDDFEFALQQQQLQHDSSFDGNELLQSSIRVRNKQPSPTVGAYLSPPAQRNKDLVIGKATGPSSPSLLASQKYLQELSRRRPNKSYSDNRSSADLDFSPSEQHAEREVNAFGTSNGNDERTHQKRKNIYSVTQTASTKDGSYTAATSGNRTTAITISSTGIGIRAFAQPTSNNGRKRTRTNTNAHQKYSSGGTLSTAAAAAAAGSSDEGSSASTATATATASLPTNYYAGYGKTRVRPTTSATTPTTFDIQQGQEAQPPTAATTATTTAISGTLSKQKTNKLSTSSQRTDVYAVNPEIFRNHLKTQYHLNSLYTSTSAPPSSTDNHASHKRINYNYHPIIDFFKYNSRIADASQLSSTLKSSVKSTKATHSTKPKLEIHSTSATHFYPHKIPNSVPANIYTDPTQEQNDASRIGYGAAGGDGFSSGSDVVVYNNSNQFRISTNKISNNKFSSRYLLTKIDGQASERLPLSSANLFHNNEEQQDDWHPVVIQEI